MPLISTRGGLSSRGFGQFSRIAEPTLQTLTFPAGSSTFTVPAATNNIISAVGAGADGTPGGTSTQGASAAIFIISRTDNTVGYPPGQSLTWEQLINSLNSLVAVFNAGGTVYYQITIYGVYTDNLCYSFTPINATADSIIPNTASAVINWGFPYTPRTGPITYANTSPAGQATFFQVQYTRQNVVNPTTGAATTGFGLTFPGGAGGASSTTSFSNVAVTPNQTYTIQNNKSLTITYLA
jgi:hypothetical protein